MADFHKVSLIMLGLGYQMDMHLMAGSGAFSSYNRSVEATLIIGFLCYTTAVILGLLINFGELKGNFIATVFNAILDYLACLFLIIGVAIYGSLLAPRTPPAYSTTMYAISMIFAFLAGLFLTLELAQCKPPKTGTAAAGK